MLKALDLAQCRDGEADGARRRENRGAGRNLDGPPVDRKLHGVHSGAKSEGRNPKAERRPKSEGRNPKYGGVASMGYFLQIAPKMRFSSLASRQSTRASEARPSSAVATMRRKNILSLDSFRHVPIFCLNSLPETASSASQ